MFGCTTLVLIAFGCAGTIGSEETRAPAASAGDEPPPTAAAQAPEEEVRPARGRIVVQAKCAGKSVVAVGKMPIERGLIVDFKMGQEFSAEVGTRHIEVTLDDDSALIDRPTLQIEVPVEERKTSQVEAVFPWAKVQLNVLVNGTVQPPTSVKLIRKGEVVAEVKSSTPHFLVSPGNYEADVQLKAKTVRVKGLVFFEGTEQVVPVRVTR
jgi:hypothetical protein